MCFASSPLQLAELRKLRSFARVAWAPVGIRAASSVGTTLADRTSPWHTGTRSGALLPLGRPQGVGSSPPEAQNRRSAVRWETQPSAARSRRSDLFADYCLVRLAVHRNPVNMNCATSSR